MSCEKKKKKVRSSTICFFFPLDKIKMPVVKSGKGNNEYLGNDACVKYSRPLTKCGKGVIRVGTRLSSILHGRHRKFRFI